MRSAVSGLALGALFGVLWWATELVTHWAAGSVLPPVLMMGLARWDVGLAAAVGLLAGPLVGRDRSTLALVLAAVFGLLRVYSPPGFSAELVFLIGAVVVTVVGRALAPADRATIWPLLQSSVLISGTFAIFEVLVNESHLAGLYGARLPVAVAALPLAPLLLDRVLALAVSSRPVRFGLELLVAVVAISVVGRPLSVAPYHGDRVTADAQSNAPDIYLVVLDTVRADHLSTYGYERETSPRLTEFAADALVFEQAHSTAGWTLPGHASMLTGLYPSRHGARAAGGWLPGQSVDGRRNVAFPLGDEQVTLAEMLRTRGYHTAGFVANFSYLYRSFGFAQGFEIYDDAPWRILRFRSPVMHFMEARWPTTFTRPYRSGHDINAAAQRWLDATAPDRPAFVFLNYMDAHPPYLAPEPYTEWVKNLPSAPKLARRDLYAHEPRALTSDERAYIEACYDGQLRAADAAFGAFIDDLKRRGRYDNALIILTADHGTLIGEHGHVGHVGRMLFEPLLHVPMVVKFPGATHPVGRSTVPVQNMDVFQTALTAAGIPLPAGTQGESLPNVTHPILAEDDVNAFLVWRYGTEYDRAIRVLVETPYKLITTSRGDRYLFDITADPTEHHNLLTEDPSRANTMTQRLQGLLPFEPVPAAAGAPPPP